MDTFRSASACLIALFTAACAHQTPVEQTRLFEQAFANVQSASQPLLDEAAVAERQRGRVNAILTARAVADAGQSISTATGATADAETAAALRAAADARQAQTQSCNFPWRPLAGKAEAATFGYIMGFCNGDATYNSELRDPPLTHAYRTGITALGKYSELLVILAEGRNIGAAQAQMESLAGSLAAGLALIPGAQTASVAVLPVVQQLAPVIATAAQEKNYEELKRVAVQQRSQFSNLTRALQTSAPELFRLLIFNSEQEITRNGDNRRVLESSVATISGYRRLVSDLVVLLLDVDEAHGILVAALEREQPPSLALTAERAQRLTINAEALRQTFVAVRRGAPL
jgi:hypothetical protein